MKRIPVVLILICVALFAYSGYRVALHLWGYKTGEASYSTLEQYVTPPTAPSAASGEQPGQEQQPAQFPAVDFAALRAVNPDIVGWLSCEGTAINYPVVQRDNTYYLNHLFDGSVNPSGCLFLNQGSAADFSDSHSIIYGHHMKNGAMFSSLEGYKTQAYFDAHPQILLSTPDANYRIEIFAAYVANTNDPAWVTQFATQEDYRRWMDDAIKRSSFQSGITPLATDRVVTLSTCSYDFQDARFVVLGVLRPYPAA